MPQRYLQTSFTRRDILKSGFAATSLFLPQPFAWVWAQTEGTIKLLRLPKLALVVGNSKYKYAPGLNNPVNDARAMSETLRQSGFDVTARLDSDQDGMAAAIRTYVQTLAAKKAVGLFYFAGHGVQLAWRNYLIPVDAAARHPDDIQKSCIDLVGLMAGINKASNPLNVVILDACRDNPFGGEVRIENRGLSQMDAPHSTLLAYATAPGNVASDGDGANGLYTENLVREMQVPEAKLEDVFKRVRLSVRRRSNGRQIPWESTSLEDDFYFIPPKELKRISDAEAQRLFEQELALWENIKQSKEPGPLEDYLRRFPGGKFSELAQLQLDRVLAAQGEKKIEIVSDAKNPYSKGTAAANTRYKVGDSYTYRVIDQFTKLEQKTITSTVTDITESEVIYDSGHVTDLLGNTIRSSSGGRFTDRQVVPLEFTVGKRWVSRYQFVNNRGYRYSTELEFHIVTRESVTVPAGTFDAFKTQGRGWSTGERGATLIEQNVWYAPSQIRRPVISELLRQTDGRVHQFDRDELVAFKES